ncbi:MAG: UDP-N-acetylmuramoyl-L-alanine--D-glutamate ligase [Cyanobacteria bacterium K_DeepCast_35m_m2_023]|nr:UDP-N-acetylmuramoyl-L-alanine--D-glutamate ligase [Cyanobacteria bacterium K_DeepCast_35m_m2_023]
MPSNPSDLQVVIGLGRSGVGAARLLRAQGKRVLLLEQNHNPQLELRAHQLEAEGVNVQLGCDLTAAELPPLAGRPQTVIVSPGMRWDHPQLERWRQQGVAIEGELVPAWRASQGVPWIGITGTNGKTTVTHLVSHLLQSQGIDAPMGGNVGHSAAELVLQRCQGNGPRPQWLVMEMSSYQIEAATEIAPQIGIWTTLTPDHLERHGSLDAYRAIKRGLLQRSRLRILNADDRDLKAQAASWDEALWISAAGAHNLPAHHQAALWIDRGRVWQRRSDGSTNDLMAADALAMPGAHNRQNMLMAVAAGLAAGLSPAQLAEGLARFPGVPHRLERIRTLAGVTYVNDSKATNYDAAQVALEALAGPLLVLAGGEAKIGEARGWVEALQRQAAAVILFGAAQQHFAELLQQGGYSGVVHRVPSLAEAVPLALSIAPKHHCQAVLLSPACASFDQYSDFEARGDHFRALVNALSISGH